MERSGGCPLFVRRPQSWAARQSDNRRAPFPAVIRDERWRTAVKSQRPLDWLNFFLADVKDGLGPFLAIYPTG
jgi:hypothetical protein